MRGLLLCQEMFVSPSFAHLAEKGSIYSLVSFLRQPELLWEGAPYLNWLDLILYFWESFSIWRIRWVKSSLLNFTLLLEC